MTMRRRTAGVVAAVLGAAALLPVWPAQASTWLPGVSVSDETGDVAYVEGQAVVVDAAGTATAIWQTVLEIEEAPFEIDVVQTATRPAGGPDFGPVQALGQGSDPAIVAHPDGSVTAAWQQDGTLRTATRPAGDGAFPTAAPVPDVPSGQLEAAPGLTVDEAGNVTMALLVDGALWWTARDGGSGAWSTPAPVPEAVGVADFDVEAAPDGIVTFAWEEVVIEGLDVYEYVRAWRRSPEGPLGGVELVDYSRGRLSNVALTDNAAGVTALSWVRAGTPAADLQVALRARTDDAFSTRDGISGDDHVTRGVALVVDDAGRVAGAWTGETQGVVGVTRETDGTVTTTPLTVGDQFVQHVDASVDPDGVLTVAWQQAAGSFFIAASRRPPGEQFEAPVTLTNIADGRADHPALAVAPSGDVTVVYAYSPEDGPASRHVRAQVLDANAPTLTATVPATGSPGTALSMSAVAGDLWGPVSVSWSFGDGSTATGTTAIHTYAGTGSFVVRVNATDGSGNATTLSRTVKVGSPAVLVGDRTPPVLTRVRLAPDLLPTGHGSQLKVTSTEAGRLVGVIERRRPNGQWAEVGTKRWSLQPGRSSKTFYGMAAQTRLDAGKHRVRLVATDVAGNASSPVGVRFRVGPR